MMTEETKELINKENRVSEERILNLVNESRQNPSFLETQWMWLSKVYDIFYLYQPPIVKYNKGYRKMEHRRPDFYLPDSNVIIECDGAQHRGTKEADSEREKFLKEELPNVEILRVTAENLHNNSFILRLVSYIKKRELANKKA